jgi:hypothetical protein
MERMGEEGGFGIDLILGFLPLLDPRKIDNLGPVF